jgi:hypothetical protein
MQVRSCRDGSFAAAVSLVARVVGWIYPESAVQLVVFINSLTCEFPNRIYASLCRGAHGPDYDSVTATLSRE